MQVFKKAGITMISDYTDPTVKKMSEMIGEIEDVQAKISWTRLGFYLYFFDNCIWERQGYKNAMGFLRDMDRPWKRYTAARQYYTIAKFFQARGDVTFDFNLAEGKINFELCDPRLADIAHEKLYAIARYLSDADDIENAIHLAHEGESGAETAFVFEIANKENGKKALLKRRYKFLLMPSDMGMTAQELIRKVCPDLIDNGMGFVLNITPKALDI
jgi:hypothetical protein